MCSGLPIPLGFSKLPDPSQFSTDGHHERMHHPRFSTAFHRKKADSCDEQPLLRNLENAHCLMREGHQNKFDVESGRNQSKGRFP